MSQTKGRHAQRRPFSTVSIAFSTFRQLLLENAVDVLLDNLQVVLAASVADPIRKSTVHQSA
jgi:hypothetical protein